MVDGAVDLLVDPADGMMHHYRQTPLPLFEKRPELFQFIEDTYMFKFKEQLSDAVNRRLATIGPSVFDGDDDDDDDVVTKY